MIRRELWIASIGVLVVIGALKHLGAISSWAFTAAAAVQLVVPYMLIGKRGITEASIGLDRGGNLAADLKLAAVVAVLTVVPFALGHHAWQTMVLGRHFALPTVSGAAAYAIGEAILVQVVAVALPEEIFFRGYLQGRFAELWPRGKVVFGVVVGPAIVVSSVVFAFAHFVGEYNPVRLAPFFPSLVFGWMRARTGRINAPIAYHAFCNLLSDALWRCYRL